MAIAYPIVLLLLVILMRTVGEHWWLTGLLLYLPRIGLALPLPVIAVLLVLYREHRVLLTQVVAFLLVIFPLMGFVLPFPTSKDHDAPTLRVLSYNVDSDRVGYNAIGAEVERQAADIVLLQEAAWNDEGLLKRLSTTYPSVKTSTQFIAASKFPITSFEEPEKLAIHDENRSGRFVRITLDTPEGNLVVYCVHPLSPRGGLYRIRGSGLRREIMSGRLFSGERADWLGSDAELRDLQVKTFTERAAKETDPVIIAGDTNLPALSPSLGRYLSGFQDGFREASWGFGYTYPADRFLWMRLDRIFASSALRFVHFEVCPKGVSDHVCVLAELQRRH